MSDLDVLVGIEDQCFAAPNWGREDFENHDCLVAECDGKVAGFIVFRELFPGDGENATQWEILNVAVAPVQRRRGLAKTLMIEVLRRSGEFFLEVRESNLAARELYCSLGFVEVGRRPKYYQFPEETAIVMKMKRC
jgi:ribosomal protein S18 acetylase RimI-like enzyme